MRLKSLILTLSLFGVIACHDNTDRDREWDIYPTIILISVEDPQGNDLLNPEVEGNIADRGIKAIYKGDAFEKDSVVNNASRVYLAVFRGLQTDTLANGRYVLTLGEFAGNKDYRNEEIEIDWNDGSRNTIAFDSKFSWKDDKPSVERVFYLDGKKTEFPIKVIK